MNDIQIFKNPQFGEVRVTINTNNEPLFCLTDICKMLDLGNPSQVKARLNPNGVHLIQQSGVTNNEGVYINKLGNTTTNFINETNLYKCIFQSRKPEAEKFQDWVCEEVLPSIRKTGGYIVIKPEDSAEDLMARALLVAKATIEKKEREIAEAQKEVKEKAILLESANEAMKEKDAKIAQDAPKVLFADAVTGSRSTCLVGELAKLITQNGYTIGQNRLFRWLRENGYLGTKGEYYNVPNQQYMEMGLFDVKKTVHDENGVMVTKTTTKVTGKGCAYFINKFLNQAHGVKKPRKAAKEKIECALHKLGQELMEVGL